MCFFYFIPRQLMHTSPMISLYINLLTLRVSLCPIFLVSMQLFLLLSIPIPMSLFFFFFFFLLLSTFFFLYRFYSSSSSSSHYSPPSYPFIGCLISFFKNRRRLLHWYTDLLSNSPTLTILVHRLGSRRTIVTADPVNVEYMLKTNFVNYPKGKPFTDILGDLLGFGIFNVDGELWSTQRKLASHEFTTKSLREFVVKTLEEEVHLRLIPLLQKASKTNCILDLQDVLKRLAFDTICKVSLGTDQQCLDLSRPVPPLVNAFDTATEVSAKRAIAPVFLAWKAKRILNIGSEKKLKESVQLVHTWVSEVIHNKKLKSQLQNEGNIDCGGDLLSRLLSAGHGEEVVRDMVISFIMAGRDTTSAAMTWLFWLLTQHPNAEENLLDEVNSMLNNSQRSFVYEDLKEMKYLKACLCESMRLYPPVVWDSKHAATDDILPDGTPVRKGDRVTYFPYGMGRMEELWGKNRLEFKPDRWFGDNGELKSVSPFKFPVFQAGPRTCLGKEMAFIQMKYVMATVLKRFEFRPVCKSEPVFVPLLTAHMAGGLQVYVRERTDKSQPFP